MAHRNRWFTVLENGWIFHGYVKQPDGSDVIVISFSDVIVIWLVVWNMNFWIFHNIWE